MYIYTLAPNSTSFLMWKNYVFTSKIGQKICTLCSELFIIVLEALAMELNRNATQSLRMEKVEVKLFLFDDEMVIWKAPPQPKSMKDLL